MEKTKAPDWAIPAPEAADQAADFIRTVLADAGMDRIVIGLSGGIDSAVSAALAVRALGADKVLGVFMPSAASNPDSLADGREVAECLGIETELVEISPLVEAWEAMLPGADALRRGNVMARCRMIVLYDISARDGRLVLGTGNRSEDLLGYTTMFGDNACALNPLGRLYKTEVRLLAEYLGLPESVRVKRPSADLWQGQADEDELGFSYAEADRLMHGMLDEGLGRKQLESLGFAPELISRVAERIEAMAFKRTAAPVAAFGGRDASGGSAT